MIDQLESSKDLLSWRPGDRITIKHRKAVARWLVKQGNYSEPVVRATKKNCLTDPEERFAEVLMPFVGMMSAMDIRTFLREFPVAANTGDGLVLELFMRMKFPREGAPL
jgi:hypothetical protein